MKNSFWPEAAALRLTIAPLSIYLLSMAALEFGGLGFTESRYVLPAAQPQTSVSISLLTLNQARITWLSSVLLFTTTSCAVLAVSILFMRESLSRKGFLLFMLVGAGLGLSGILQLASGMAPDSDLGLIFHLTYDSIQATRQFTAADMASLASLVSLVNILAVVAPPFLMLAGCSLIPMPAASSPADPRHVLQIRMNKLKSLIHLGSAMLVAGSLHLLLWSRLPIAFTDDMALQKAIGDWALSITQYCGITYSLMLAGLYVPCALALIENTETLLQHAMPELPESELTNWLNQHGFSTSPLQQLPQIIAALAPMLAGQIGSAMTGLGLTLG